MAKEPAKPRASKSRKTPKTEDKVTDAEVVKETPAPEKKDAVKDDTPAPEKATDASEETPVEEPKAEEPAPEAPKDEPVAQEKPAEPYREPPRQSVFIPMVLGGLFAGAIGYGVAYLQYADQGPQTAPEVLDRLSALESAEAPDVDLTPVTEQLDSLAQSQDEAVARLDSEIAALGERMTTVEKQPSGDGTLQEAAIAAYERDIEELRGQIADQQTALQDMAENAVAQLEATRAEAVSIEQSAVQAARDATARASLARVQGALETGGPLGAIIADLEDALGSPAPDALTAAPDGVPTLASLQADYPAASRAALKAARSEGESGEATGGFSAFLRNQLDVRSTTPQEGNSVDAILSRAEAALREGRLNDTLAEVATLPEVARAAMGDWIAAAETRAAAVDAADALATTLTDN